MNWSNSVLTSQGPVPYSLRTCRSPSPQVIEDPVEIIDNDRELKGFYNLDEDTKLVGYFKSERSRRKYWSAMACAVLSGPVGTDANLLHVLRLSQTSSSSTTPLRSSTPSSSSSPPSIPK